MAVVGWVDTADAATYLSNKVGASAWAGLSLSDQTKYLTTAYRSLIADPDYSFPSTVAQAMKDAQTEYAWALYDGNPEKRRQLIAQGVTSFRIGQFAETYGGKAVIGGSDLEGYGKYPVIVADLIRTYRNELDIIGYVTRDLDDDRDTI